MIYVSDVQKAAAAYAQDLKENSAEYGFGSGSPRKVRCISCKPRPCIPALRRPPLSGLSDAKGCSQRL